MKLFTTIATCLLAACSPLAHAQYVSVGTNALAVMAVPNLQVELPVSPMVSLASTVGYTQYKNYSGSLGREKVFAVEVVARIYTQRARLHEGFHPLFFTQFAQSSSNNQRYLGGYSLLKTRAWTLGTGLGYLHVGQRGFLIGGSLGIGGAYVANSPRDLEFGYRSPSYLSLAPHANISLGWRIFNEPGRERWNTYKAERRASKSDRKQRSKGPRNVW